MPAQPTHQPSLVLDRLPNREANDLDVSRFLAATVVILAHAYPLTLGRDGEAADPLGIWTQDQHER